MEYKEEHGTLWHKAYKIAEKYHAGQVDKAGKPYMEHLLKVSSTVVTLDEQVVALLHDILEDTSCSATDLVQYGIPAKLVTSIEAMSRKPGEQYSLFIKRVKKDPIARVVKLADLEHNMDVTRFKNPSTYPESLRKRYLKAKQDLLDVT